MKKKGQTAIDSLTGLVPIIVGLALVLVVGFLIMSQLKTQSESIATTTSTVANETVAGNAAGTTVAFANIHNSMGTTLTCFGSVYNASDNLLIDPLNYTCTSAGITLATASENGSYASLKVSYTYKPTTTAYNATTKTQATIDDIPGWIPIIIVTIIGALLLGLVAYFRSR